jgi:hypothetical protein
MSIKLATIPSTENTSEIERKKMSTPKLLDKILKPRRKLNVTMPATFNKLQAVKIKP